MLTSLIATTAAATPLEWSPTVGGIMVFCNIIAIAFAKSSIKIPNSAPAMPASNMFGGFGLPAVLASTSFGHILGIGVILGLHSIGRI
ncbi:MAG: photosystem I reaction center subunit PsaK [Methylacidiphilales bacterium]|nr:photosystem I reaction center subunit PsaK [Candidatus Methylacidiphilales bacterium]NJR17799.1 photosystem I reaction center subunit PsaK [Calothrix sp. CSU_2_0]